MTISPDQIGIFIGCFVLLIPAIYFIQKLSGKAETRNITPQPLVVTAAPNYQSRLDCERIHLADNQERDAIRKALEEREIVARQESLHIHQALVEREISSDRKFETLRLEIKKDIGGLHDKVNASAVAIGEMRGELRRVING